MEVFDFMPYTYYTRMTASGGKRIADSSFYSPTSSLAHQSTSSLSFQYTEEFTYRCQPFFQCFLIVAVAYAEGEGFIETVSRYGEGAGFIVHAMGKRVEGRGKS